MPHARGLTIKVMGVVLSPFDVQFQETLDETARRVFQELMLSYRARLDTFVTMWSGPRLVLQACPANQDGSQTHLSPTQFQWMVDQTGGHAPVVDMMITKRLELFEQGRFTDARALSGDYKYDDGADTTDVAS